MCGRAPVKYWYNNNSCLRWRTNFYFFFNFFLHHSFFFFVPEQKFHWVLLTWAHASHICLHMDFSTRICNSGLSLLRSARKQIGPCFRATDQQQQSIASRGRLYAPPFLRYQHWLHVFLVILTGKTHTSYTFTTWRVEPISKKSHLSETVAPWGNTNTSADAVILWPRYCYGMATGTIYTPFIGNDKKKV